MAAAAAMLPLTGSANARQMQVSGIDPGGYIALGDSYSSGEGNPPFFDDSGCDVSPYAWPSLVFSARNKPKVPFLGINLACSGAKITDLSRPFKGRLAQLDLLGILDPDIVTVTIGGNDVGFGNVLAHCFVHDCTGRLLQAEKDIARLEPTLRLAFLAIARAAPNARVLAVGYPRLLSAGTQKPWRCLWLKQTEQTTLNQLAKLLDAVERQAAKNAGIEYVSVLGALEGHELCTRQSWVYDLGRNGSNYRGHPLLDGQLAISKIVEKAIG